MPRFPFGGISIPPVRAHVIIQLYAPVKKACLLYTSYRAAQQEMRQAVAVKTNIDHLLGVTDGRKNKEQER